MTDHPIVTVQLPGRGLAQGETVLPLDALGNIPCDMHGVVAINASGAIVAGKPVLRVGKQQKQ